MNDRVLVGSRLRATLRGPIERSLPFMPDRFLSRDIIKHAGILDKPPQRIAVAHVLSALGVAQVRDRDGRWYIRPPK